MSKYIVIVGLHVANRNIVKTVYYSFKLSYLLLDFSTIVD